MLLISVDTAARGPSSVQSPSAASPTTPASTNGTGAARSAKLDGIKTNFCGDVVRDKCIEMFYDALCIDSSACMSIFKLCLSHRRSLIINSTAPAHIEKLSTLVENELYGQQGCQTTSAYRTKFRSLYLNLKDKSNPRLRQDVVSGIISPERLANMSTKDMASDQRKQEDKKLTEANFHQALGSEELAAETDAFQCSRCKQVCTPSGCLYFILTRFFQRKTRYYQQQTRSADEPMTVRLFLLQYISYKVLI